MSLVYTSRVQGTKPKKEPTTLGEKWLLAQSSPSKRKKQSQDPRKRHTSREECRWRALTGSNTWESLSCLSTLLQSVDKNYSEVETDSLARQKHHGMVQNCWVNLIKQQIARVITSFTDVIDIRRISGSPSFTRQVVIPTILSKCQNQKKIVLYFTSKQ